MKIIREKNVVALKNLQENLINENRSIFRTPLVLQYNKRDLADKGIPLLSIARMQKDLNSQLKAPAFGASAIDGVNVVKTANKIISLAVGSIRSRLQKG
jgi:hypothetical protein